MATNATTNPRFTAPFDVGSSDKYISFIAGIRSRLANPKHFSHNRPVLPPVEEPKLPPRRWFHVQLRTTTSTLTLATRADNLYLEGFRSRDGTWWELTRGLIPGATYVGFGGTYRDLLGDTDKLVGVLLGPQQMTEAVNALAARTRADLTSGAKQQQAREAVVALLLMAAEKSGTITKEMKAQVNGWQDLSEALLKTDRYEVDKPEGKGKGQEKSAAEKKPPPIRPEAFNAFDKMGVKTADKAAETVGILLFVQVPGGMTETKALQLFRASVNY
ncbi:hypothetical protein ACQ4PT_034341 [Festuca glaucescens]